MARKQARPEATQEMVLEPVQITCRACGNRMRIARHSQRTVTTLQGVIHLTLKVYRCLNADCPRFCQVTASYWEGLFACYQLKDLPRTNQECRRCQLRFRRAPDAYLTALEQRLCNPSLPS